MRGLSAALAAYIANWNLTYMCSWRLNRVQNEAMTWVADGPLSSVSYRNVDQRSVSSCCTVHTAIKSLQRRQLCPSKLSGARRSLRVQFAGWRHHGRAGGLSDLPAVVKTSFWQNAFDAYTDVIMWLRSILTLGACPRIASLVRPRSGCQTRNIDVKSPSTDSPHQQLLSDRSDVDTNANLIAVK